MAADITVRVRLLNNKNEVLLILEKGGKEVRKSDGTSFPKPEGWGLPGGRVQPNETPLEAAHRELREEAGVFADIDDEPIKTVVSEDGSHEVRCFAARNPRGEARPHEPFIIAAEWVDHRLAYNSLPYHGRHIRIYNSHEPLIHCRAR